MTESQTADLFRTLGRIEAILESNNTTLAQHIIEDTAEFQAVNTRLTVLERMRWQAAGALGVFALLGAAADFIWRVFFQA